MRIPGTHKLRQINYQIQRHFATEAVILMYHRIAEVPMDPWGLSVTPQNFAEQLAVMKQYAQPMHLSDLAKAHCQGHIPRRAIVVTFDDGYADNFYNAKPLLEEFGIPATVFISTGYLDQTREFWWDEIEGLLLQPGTLPAHLQLEINGHLHEWDLGTAAHYPDSDYQRDRQHPLTTPGSRFAFFNTIWAAIHPLPEAEQSHVLQQLRIWVTTNPQPRDSNRPLTGDELIKLGQSPMIEIGAHTVTHPCLTAHPSTIQQTEIEQSKVQLEAILDRPITTFSYPFGAANTETTAITADLGFDCACSTVSDIVWRQSNRFQFPRFKVDDWNGHEFAQKLSQWFGE
jgi:peptidoglycan/xylan/chitin deacetylase (PgdA/CDA1 family)